MLKKRDIACPEGFQRRCLRQIQGLHDKTSNTICLALLGILPVEAVFYINALTTFVNMIRQKGSIENDIALRQLVMKDENDKSLFMFVRGILKLYNLPSIFQVLNNPPSKAEWKKILNNAVNSTIEASWKQDIKDKSSLK